MKIKWTCEHCGTVSIINAKFVVDGNSQLKLNSSCVGCRSTYTHTITVNTKEHHEEKSER